MGKDRIFEVFIPKTANMQYRYGARSKNGGGGGGTIYPLVEIGLTYLPKCMALNIFFFSLHLYTIFTIKHDF